MRPVLFSFHLPLLGEVAFPAYFTFLTIGFTIAILLSSREARRLQIAPDKIVDFGLYMFLFGLIGARLLHIIADGFFWDYVHICTSPEVVKAVGSKVPTHCTIDAQCGPYFLCNQAAGHCYPPRDCLLAFKFWRGGLTYYGGFIFAFIYGLYFLRRHQLPLWKVADLVGFGIPLGLFWGRLGCFFNGCCFGKATESWLGMIFPRGGAVWRHQLEEHLISSAARHPLAVHPTQLYEALFNLLLFFFAYFYWRKRKKFDGQIFWWFILLYSVFRFFVEFLRDDARGVIVGLLSTSQLISIPGFVLAILMLRYLKRRVPS